MKGIWAVVLVAGCTIEIGAEPEPQPPPPLTPPWGVPITGGTMTVTRDDRRAVIADPDRDFVITVDLTSEQVIDTIALPAGSEPGRVIEDGIGRIHVALRRSGNLLTLTGDTQLVRPVCGEPRGVAWEQAGDLVHVACATGELVTFPAGGGEPTRVVRIGRDLRDVIVREHGLVVTTFRTAELIEVDPTGVVIDRRTPPVVKRGVLELGSVAPDTIASVAWRTIPLADGRILMSHQRRSTARLTTQPSGYGGGQCGPAIQSAVTILGINDAITPVAPRIHSLPVDAAQNPLNGEIAFVSAGQNTVWIFTPSSIDEGDTGQCKPAGQFLIEQAHEPPSSIAFTRTGTRLVFYPSSATLHVTQGNMQRSIVVAPSGGDLGRIVFHAQTGVGFACASCHPEGRDDGAVWDFQELGLRRTQNLGGGVMDRAPFHWSGDMTDLSVLVDNVFVGRMAAGGATDDQKRALAAWLDRIPAPRGVITDALAVERGKQLFFDSAQGCASCHNGELMTNNALTNVGTSGMFKVPSLVGVGARAPYLHDGCARTLRDRFGACGGGDLHGHTSHLGEAELADLIAYLESL